MDTGFKAGDHVRVSKGVYKDTEGAVEDVMPECSVLRLETPEGAAYAHADELQKVVPVQPSKAVTKKPLSRR
jgi:ribosomal protein L24